MKAKKTAIARGLFGLEVNTSELIPFDGHGYGVSAA